MRLIKVGYVAGRRLGIGLESAPGLRVCKLAKGGAGSRVVYLGGLGVLLTMAYSPKQA